MDGLNQPIINFNDSLLPCSCTCNLQDLSTLVNGPTRGFFKIYLVCAKNSLERGGGKTVGKCSQLKKGSSTWINLSSTSKRKGGKDGWIIVIVCWLLKSSKNNHVTVQLFSHEKKKENSPFDWIGTLLINRVIGSSFFSGNKNCRSAN